MPKRGTTVALMLLSFALALSSCSKGGRVLSEHKMEMLYTDMFLADQWLRDHPKYRAMADTTLFFDFFHPMRIKSGWKKLLFFVRDQRPNCLIDSSAFFASIALD